MKIIEIGEKQILDSFDQNSEFPLRKITKRKENAKNFASFWNNMSNYDNENGTSLEQQVSSNPIPSTVDRGWNSILKISESACLGHSKKSNMAANCLRKLM